MIHQSNDRSIHQSNNLQNGSIYVDFSGTLQNQERVYFGPVNIHRMSISLVSDRGDVVNLCVRRGLQGQ